MGTYVIGDVHGCFSQFMELIERIEEEDSDARFILVGDIVNRGSQDAQMLAWAYENITLVGKFQMVLGNHDDTFIEIFGKREFETLYSLSREINFSDRPNKGEFWYLEDQKELMYQYAKFLASQPLFKKLEINGKKYIIAHAWYPEALTDPDLEPEHVAYKNRFNSIWYRDRKDYKGGFEDEYEPIEGEILIHGHTPTITYKKNMSCIHSPGKIWRRKNSINIDCGLVFNVTGFNESFAKFGNLAAYHIEADEALYLWDIVDEYALNDDEYYECRIEREKNEREESKRRLAEAWETAKDPYIETFYKQILGLDEVSEERDYKYRKVRVDFNFLDNFIGVSTFNDYRKSHEYDFDFENLPIIAVYGTRDKKMLYAYDKSHGKWTGVELEKCLFEYQAFKYNGGDYLFGINDYLGEEAKGVLYHLSGKGVREVVKFNTETSSFDWRKKADILKLTDKFDEDGKPTGIMTWDFYHKDELCTIKNARNVCDVHHAHISNSKGEILSQISCINY